VVRQAKLLALAVLYAAAVPVSDEASDLRQKLGDNNHVSVEFSGTARIDGAEINILGTLGPDKFFENLVRITDPDGVRFMREGAEVKAFPKVLTMRIVLVGPVARGKKTSTVQLDDEFMRSLRFQVQWKRGLETQPIRDAIIREVSTGSPSVPTLKSWAYILVIEDVDAALGDHLIVIINSRDGKNLSRLSSHL
jgi:hypothetical protein